MKMQIFNHPIIHSKGTQHTYLENTTSSTTANEPLSDINQTNTATQNSNHQNGNDITKKTSNIRTDRNNLRKIIASIEKVLRTTKSLNKKGHLLQW